MDEWTLREFADSDSPLEPEDHRRLLERSEQAGMAATKRALEQLGVEAD